MNKMNMNQAMNDEQTLVRMTRMHAIERVREVIEFECKMKVTLIRPSRYNEQNNYLEVVMPYITAKAIRQIESNRINVLQVTGESASNVCAIVEVTRLR